MRAIVIMSEQHQLWYEQKILLNKRFHKLVPGDELWTDEVTRDWEILSVPADGWTLKEQKDIVEQLMQEDATIVFASPIPYLLKELARLGKPVLVFHTDKREKKELPGGKIISVVAKDGWQLV